MSVSKRLKTFPSLLIFYLFIIRKDHIFILRLGSCFRRPPHLPECLRFFSPLLAMDLTPCHLSWYIDHLLWLQEPAFLPAFPPDNNKYISLFGVLEKYQTRGNMTIFYKQILADQLQITFCQVPTKIFIKNLARIFL